MVYLLHVLFEEGHEIAGSHAAIPKGHRTERACGEKEPFVQPENGRGLGMESKVMCLFMCWSVDVWVFRKTLLIAAYCTFLTPA